MMCGPGILGGIYLGLLLVNLLILGFAYIIWVLAGKESGNIKLLGQILSAVVAIIVIILLLYSCIYGGMMGRGRYGKLGKGAMMSCPMMKAMEGKEGKLMMEKMMKGKMKK